MKVRYIILSLLFALPLTLLFLFLRDSLAVDSALDSGASYDYARSSSDYSQNHPYIPFYDRHITLIWSSIISTALALVAIFKTRRNINAEQVGSPKPAARAG